MQPTTCLHVGKRTQILEKKIKIKHCIQKAPPSSDKRESPPLAVARRSSGVLPYNAGITVASGVQVAEIQSCMG